MLIHVWSHMFEYCEGLGEARDEELSVKRSPKQSVTIGPKHNKK